MSADIDKMIESTGLAVPLAGRIVAMLVDSGASQLEMHTALGIAGMLVPTLPVSLVAEPASSPDLSRPES